MNAQTENAIDSGFIASYIYFFNYKYNIYK